MRMRAMLVLGALVLLAADDKAKQDQEALQGAWRCVALEANGEKAPEEEAKKMTIVFKGDLLTAHTEGQEVAQEGKIVLDPSVKPKIMDFTYTKGDQKDKKLEGIYEVEKDDLKICANVMGTGRPTEFKSSADTILLTFKREKK